jgi:hypothetical protein
MVGADLARGAILVPVNVAGLLGQLPIWGLVLAAFLLQTATSYFAPAYGAVVPTVVERRNVQQANALVQSTEQALSVAGWAAAAGLLAVLPISAFFALNAASFFVSALLVSTLAVGRAPARAGEPPRLRDGVAELGPRPALAAAVAVLGVAVTISSGTWIAGVPTFVRDTLGRGAGSFSIVMVGYAAGSIAAGALLAHRPVRRKTPAAMQAWALYLPAYLLFALGGSLPTAVAGAAAAGIGQGSASYC